MGDGWNGALYRGAVLLKQNTTDWAIFEEKKAIIVLESGWSIRK